MAPELRLETEHRHTVLAAYERRVRSFLRSRVRNEADAEDIAQETFLAFLTCESVILDAEAWLINAARCKCIDFHRRERCRRAAAATSDATAMSRDPQDIVVELQSARELLDRLVAPDRDLLEKLYLKGFTPQQLASLMKLSPGNVRIMALRARRRASRVVASMQEAVGAFAPLPLLQRAWLEASWRWRRRQGSLQALVDKPGLWAGQVAVTAAVVITIAAAGGPTAAAPGPGTTRDTASRIAGPAPDAAGVRAAPLQAPGAGGGGQALAGTGATGVDWGARQPAALVGAMVNPAPGAKQEDASFSTLTPSPAYADDGTVFASGHLLRGCQAPCYTLFETTDRGVSWRRLPAARFAGGSVLLPGTFPAEPTMFALGGAGLQVSVDTGGSFSTVVPEATAAAVDPSTPSRVLVAAPPGLVWYDSRTGELSPGPVLPASVIAPQSLAFVGTSAIDLTATEAGQGTASGLGVALVHCLRGGGCAVAASFPNARSLTMAASPTTASDHTVFAYAPDAIEVSTDDGASFQPRAVPAGVRVASIDLAPDFGTTQALLLNVVTTDATHRSEIARSTDTGRSFQWLAATFATATTHVSDAISLADGRLLAALDRFDSQYYFGIRCSTDGGSTWRAAC